MPFRRTARNRQSQTMPRRRLPRRPVERLTQLTQMRSLYTRPMVAHTDHNPLTLTHRLHFNRLPHRVEPLSIAQQVVDGTLDHRRPAFKVQLRLGFKVHVLLRRTQLSILLQGVEQRIEINLFSAGIVGIDPRQNQDFADQRFQSIALPSEARPEFFSFFRVGPLGQSQRNAQPGKR